MGVKRKRKRLLSTNMQNQLLVKLGLEMGGYLSAGPLLLKVRTEKTMEGSYSYGINRGIGITDTIQTVDSESWMRDSDCDRDSSFKRDSERAAMYLVRKVRSLVGLDVQLTS